MQTAGGFVNCGRTRSAHSVCGWWTVCNQSMRPAPACETRSKDGRSVVAWSHYGRWTDIEQCLDRTEASGRLLKLYTMVHQAHMRDLGTGRPHFI